MADTVTTLHCSILTDDDADVEDEDEDHGSHRFSISSLSVDNTNNKHLAYDDDDDGYVGEEEGGDHNIMAHMSQLSLQNSSEVGGDEDFSGVGDDSDRESGWNGVRQQRGLGGDGGAGMDVESRRKEAMRTREQWLERVWGMRRKRKEGGGGSDQEMMDHESGESECVVIAKPKGGERRLCMDMDSHEIYFQFPAFDPSNSKSKSN